MIHLRNQLMHNKEFLVGFDLPLNFKVEDGGYNDQFTFFDSNLNCTKTCFLVYLK
jgi:hypothetical protein